MTDAALKAAWVRFSAEFWRGYEAARAQSAPLAGNPFSSLSEDVFKAMIEPAMRAAYVEAAVERTRVTEILQGPGAEELPQLAMCLVLGDATAVQATSILAKAENDASKRVAMMRAQQIEPAITTLH
jgi:hypothetical protein